MGSYLKLTNFTMKEFYEIKTGHRRKCESTRTLNGQVVVITGANTGIGKETARELAIRGAKVFIGCRNLEKASQAIDDMKDDNSDVDIIALKLDLQSLNSVREFAKQLSESVNAIDILINNAGVMWVPEGQTEDGFEVHFGTNHLGHFLLTLHLLPLIKLSPKARIITVSSSGHITGRIHFENLNLHNGAFAEITAYTQSKLANVLFSRELAKRLGPESNVNTYSLHPGPVRTELQRYITAAAKLMDCIGLTPEQGSQTTLFCALDESLDNETGHYYANCRRVTNMISTAVDDKSAERLWEMSCDLVALEDYLRIP